jgi:hypothetical protein
MVTAKVSESGLPSALASELAKPLELESVSVSE